MSLSNALKSVSFFALAAVLTSAQPAGAADTTVTFRTWSPIVETTAKMAVATEAKLPGVKIDYKIFNYPDYIVDLHTRAASGDMPDLIGLEPGALTRQYQEFRNCSRGRVGLGA